MIASQPVWTPTKALTSCKPKALLLSSVSWKSAVFCVSRATPPLSHFPNWSSNSLTWYKVCSVCSSITLLRDSKRRVSKRRRHSSYRRRSKSLPMRIWSYSYKWSIEGLSIVTRHSCSVLASKHCWAMLLIRSNWLIRESRIANL